MDSAYFGGVNRVKDSDEAEPDVVKRKCHLRVQLVLAVALLHQLRRDVGSPTTEPAVCCAARDADVSPAEVVPC